MHPPNPASPTKPVDVFVLDAAQRAALVAVRDLGGAGLSVGALDSTADAPALASRWCEAPAVVPDVALGQDAYVDALLRVFAEHTPRAVLLAHDGTIEALRRRRDELEQVTRLALAPEDALAAAVDKTRTLAVAESLGLHVPRGAFVTGADEADAAIEQAGLPAVIKPTRSWSQGEGQGTRLLATVVGTRAEALQAIESILCEGVEVVVQEWLPGAREAVSLFYARGRVWARFAQRADRTFPPLGGNSVLRESIPLPPDITPAAERLVAELGLDGYSEVEFRRDAQGRPALMEINPRLSASVEIAVRAGVSFPRLLFAWAAQEPFHKVDGYRAGLRMRWLGGDLSWLRSVLTQPPGPDVPSRGRALGAFAGGFTHPYGYDYLDRRDPRPALVAASGAARRLRRVASPGTGAGAGLDTEVAVIGAGPYGLSISAQLSGSGVRHETFGEPMELWAEHMPVGMYLKSEGFASNLSDPAGLHTLERFCAEHDLSYGRVGSPIPLDTFERYGRWFQEWAVPGLRRNRVESVSRRPEGFELRLDTGETMRAGSVVVASGMSCCKYVPAALSGLPAQALDHAYDLRDPSRWSGQEVAVVGAGQSALEAAALLHEQGAHVHTIVRATEVKWNSYPAGSERPLRQRLQRPVSGLGDTKGLWVYANYPLAFHAAPESQKLKRAYTALGPSGAWWLRPRIEDQFEVVLGHTVVHAEANGGVNLRLEGPGGTQRELSVSHVVAGTGYRPEVRRLDFLDPTLRDQVATSVIGTPVLDSHFQSTSVPGLHFAGYLAGLSFGPVMRFVYGADFAARRIARRLGR